MNFIKNLIARINKWYEDMEAMFKFLFTLCMITPPFMIAFVGSGPVEAIGLVWLLALGIVRGYWVFIGLEDEKANQKVSKSDSKPKT